MKVSGASADGFLDAPRPGLWAALVFSEDEGVAHDAAERLARAWTADGPDTERISLDEETIKRDPAAFFDALEARSLLGEGRLIRIRTNGDKIASPLSRALQDADARPGRFEARLIVIAGRLPAKSKLRLAFEGADTAAAIGLNADSVSDLRALVSQTLDASGCRIDADALDLFVEALPGHRRLAHNEAEKLALFARGLDRAIDAADVRALSATDVDQDLFDFVTCVFSGHHAAAAREHDRLSLAGTQTISLVRALQREAQRLHDAHALGAASGANVGMKLSPPVFAREWPGFLARLRGWPPARLIHLMERLYDVEATAKAAGPVADAGLRQLIARVGPAASKAARR